MQTRTQTDSKKKDDRKFDFTISVSNMRDSVRKFDFFKIGIINRSDGMMREFHLDTEYVSSNAYKQVYRDKKTGKELVVGDLMYIIERELEISFNDGDFSLIAYHQNEEHSMDGHQHNLLRYYVDIPIYLTVLPKNPFRFLYDSSICYNPKNIHFLTADVMDIINYDTISRDDTMYAVIDIKIVRLNSVGFLRIIGIPDKQFPLNYKDFINRRWLKTKGTRVVESYIIDDIKMMEGRVVS